MICGGCARANDERRRYCGGCGANLAPACPRCQFVNDRGDRWCGGCGDALVAAAVGAAAGRPAAPRRERPITILPALVPAPAPALVRVVAPANDMISADDLRAMIGAAAAPAGASLPEGVVSQDDLDRLFGGGS